MGRWLGLGEREARWEAVLWPGHASRPARLTVQGSKWLGEGLEPVRAGPRGLCGQSTGEQGKGFLGAAGRAGARWIRCCRVRRPEHLPRALCGSRLDAGTGARPELGASVWGLSEGSVLRWGWGDASPQTWEGRPGSPPKSEAVPCEGPSPWQVSECPGRVGGRREAAQGRCRLGVTGGMRGPRSSSRLWNSGPREHSALWLLLRGAPCRQGWQGEGRPCSCRLVVARSPTDPRPLSPGPVVFVLRCGSQAFGLLEQEVLELAASLSGGLQLYAAKQEMGLWGPLLPPPRRPPSDLSPLGLPLLGTGLSPPWARSCCPSWTGRPLWPCGHGPIAPGA